MAARTDLHNARRVIRALEALDGGLESGPQTGELWSAGGRYAHRLVALVPEDDRAALKERIDRRVDEMLAAGALAEVAAARAAGPFSRTAAQAIGVRELCAVLDGEIGEGEAAARMKSRTRAPGAPPAHLAAQAAGRGQGTGDGAASGRRRAGGPSPRRRPGRGRISVPARCITLALYAHRGS